MVTSNLGQSQSATENTLCRVTRHDAGVYHYLGPHSTGVLYSTGCTVYCTMHPQQIVGDKQENSTRTRYSAPECP